MSDLSPNICFDALSVLNNNVQLVEKVCNICGASHYTQNCPEFAKGDHVPDKPSLNLSRSSVPNGLLIMDGADGTSCVVTSQKFAKGTRFGPLLAQKSYAPIKNIPFPLVLFATPCYYGGSSVANELDFDLQTLFNGRNVYLDTRNDNKCNWMIHVSLARFSNEQNLICYQENDEIYYTAIKDIELGDILRVWYSRNYAAKIGAALLDPSPFDVCNNILRSVSLDYGFDLDPHQGYSDSFPSTSGGQLSTSASSLMIGGGSDMNNNTSVGMGGAGLCSTVAEMGSNYDKISLPPIDSLMKTTSPKYTNHYSMFDIDLIAPPNPHHSGSPCDDFSAFGSPSTSQMHHHSSQQSAMAQQSHTLHSHIVNIQQQSPQQTMQHQHQQQQHQQMLHSAFTGYHTLPEDTLSPADLINISLGASDVNIEFDTFGTGNLMGAYDGGSNSGSNLGDSGISISGTSQTVDKLHSRYSSSTDSLATINDNLAMVPIPTVSSVPPGGGASTSADPDADKKFPCEICLRKYMTKSNLDKHMRKHNLFLCVFCMKLFQQADELKDHECSERKSKTTYLHCPKCLKVLSNSWSLQRHMKIHKDPNETVVLNSAEESVDKIFMEPKEESIFDELDYSQLDDLKPSLDALDVVRNDIMIVDDVSNVTLIEPEPIIVQNMEIEPVECTIVKPQPSVVTLPSIPSIPITNTSSSKDMITDVQAANGKQLYKCIVCAKLFKNPNALEKHLRKVHTVYTVSNDYKSEKKVLTQINQKKTSPIKPAIAKALATKLTQKNKKIESTEPTPPVPAPIIPEQPIHVPRQYNKKKQPTKATPPPYQPSVNSIAATDTGTIVPGGANANAAASNKSHSIIIISNLELTNNNLIDTSQLFLNQNGNALGNKIDVKVLNSTDKLPKLVPISNHGTHHFHQPTALLPTSIIPASANGSQTTIVPTSQYQNVSIPTLQANAGTEVILEGYTGGTENGAILDNTNQHQLINAASTFVSNAGEVIAGDTQMITLSPIKNSLGENHQLMSVDEHQSGNASFLHSEDLSADAAYDNTSNPCCDEDSDSGNPANQTSSSCSSSSATSYPCEECDRVFPKNYQLKRHMEIHDSTYYMCPYCDRSPLKAKTSVRKHLNTVHPERAPPKEEMNKFIATLVVKDEKILGELYAKNERKIRNKCAKLQAKQLQQQQQLQKQQQQQQQQNRVIVASTPVLNQVEEQQHTITPEDMLNVYPSSSNNSSDVGRSVVGDQPGGGQSVSVVYEPVKDGGKIGNGTNVIVEIKSEEGDSVLKRKSDEVLGAIQRGNGSTSTFDDNKRVKMVDVGGRQEVRYIATATATTTTAGGGINGALKYMRKKSVGIGEGSSSSGQAMHPPSGSNGTMDNQMILDNLFDNISIENYEFDDNTSIQSYNLIDERFKTSFDQIQEKLDAELSFDEEQIKWQNNLMTNDSSNEIGDKLLNVEENIMLI
ncbi:uncharacterized protein LOC129758513 isoform X1 [Uranotaenia lowii]|uniref:uncharacterized protein LOC129758513 isoform X1 n=1 Tax=Uranotaenia lowii TaxID=190385 RepID=UPI002478D92F|nr:uncharacterized protein LOC129758513 isoform X1 [Uranotaenia lowii]